LYIARSVKQSSASSVTRNVDKEKHMGRPRRSYTLWLTGHAVRFVLWLLVTAVCAAVLWRVFLSNIPPAEMKRLSPNKALAEAYEAHGEELTLYTQKQATVTKSDHNYGYFGVTRCVFIPEAEQIQLTFRYNNSTLKHVKEDFALSDVPESGIKIFDVTVVKVIDATPDDASDNVDGNPNLKKERISPSSHQIDTTGLYTYVLYTFDGVVMTDDTLASYLDVYYEGDVDYEKGAYGTLRLYHADDPKLPVELSNKEKKALKNTTFCEE
jgi:hypothetical protein